MTGPLISIVIPTKNSGRTLDACLRSIKGQSYPNHEIIIVDGFSTDATRSIAGRFTSAFFSTGSSLPAARMLGFSKARGSILFSVDSDMILENGLLGEIARQMGSFDALIIPEEGVGSGIISTCKSLEKKCYVGDDDIESLRVFSRETFESVGGYDKALHFGEDRDLHARISEKFRVGRTNSRIFHDTGHLSLHELLSKAYLYGHSLVRYSEKHPGDARSWFNLRGTFILRYLNRLAREPLPAAGLCLIKTLEYAAGLLGFVSAKLKTGLNHDRN
jgi:glycosyltransferase involved in cell wall biosynthesis